MVDFKNKSQTLEDFLATDDLFVEYFNTFLSLPSFPEPLCFNEETGGFEVVNNAKKDLARQIKAALRSQEKKKKMYKVAQNHSFINIPLIPIEEPEGPEQIEIDTSFTVTTLNKEQGIHWVKAERLPAFLESDCYLEYRLAKILSQARIVGDNGDFVIMKIDFKPRIKKVKAQEVEEEKTDPKEELMKHMFVSMGGTETTESDSWFTQAQTAQNAALTFTTLSRPVSSCRPSTGRPTSSRPRSAISAADSSRTFDSGFGSPMKSSVFNSAYFGQYTPGVCEEDEEIEEVSNQLYMNHKPITPRPSDTCCILTGDQNDFKPQDGVTYSYPKPESTDSESGVGGDTEADETDAELDYQKTVLDGEIQSISGDSTCQQDKESVLSQSQRSIPHQASVESIVLNNIDDLGAVIVGAVLKRSVSQIVGCEESSLEKDEQISALFSDSGLSHITLEMLEHISFTDAKETTDTEDTHDDSKVKPDTPDEESDVDSLLDSEEDYEEGDEFFRKHTIKTYDLTNRKGISQFKSFLKGTSGEKYFMFWIDIDRSHLFPRNKNVQKYLNDMREKYQMTGAPYELTRELKIELGLVEPTYWTVTKLKSIQNKIAAPLVTYWAPRFLLKQLMKTNPEKYYLYHHQNLLKQRKTDINPYPPTKSLLPLRPKSCKPRIQISPAIEDINPISSMVSSQQIETSPPVGMRRGYNLPKTRPSTAAPNVRQPRIKTKPREFLEPKLQVSLPAARKMSHSAEFPRRASSAKPRASLSEVLRPGSAVSVSSKESWETASVNMLVETPQFDPNVRPPTSSRPSTAKTPRRASQVSVESQFIGGQRMEALLQALENEKSCGGFFTKFVERSGNLLWQNCLSFWVAIQVYRDLFYQDTIEPYKLKVKSQFIYSKYIVTGSPCNIQCDAEIRSNIFYCLSPPYEELFDDAEEYVYQVLFSAWMANLKEDVRTYNKVELIDVKRHLETKSKYVLHLQKRGIIKERVLTPDDPMRDYEDPVYDPSLLDQIPEEFADLSLEKLVHNRIELEYFREYLAENYASMDLMCWMDIEAWRRIPHTEERKRDIKAKEIKTKYLNKKYFFGPNSPAGKEGQEKVMNAGGGWGKLLEDRPPNAVILEAQKYVRARLEKKWFPLFLTTDEFAERQKIDESMADVVDDVMVQRRRRSQAVWKLLESKWTSSTKEIIALRKGLLNPVTSLQFRRYVSIKGDNLENDVLFWQEVQKYKNMYHAHTDDALILQKINAIISCFIDSQIPPSIQVDIPHDMADKIMDRKYERGPYLFREAQLAVFRVLSSHWQSFCEFRANLADDKVLPTIERQRRHAKRKEKKKQLEMDEKMEKSRRDSEAMSTFTDPFKHLNDDSVADEGEFMEKDKVTWSYSNYIKALDKEDILNNTDESIFSSTTDLSALKESSSPTGHRPASTKSVSEDNITVKRTRFEDSPSKPISPPGEKQRKSISKQKTPQPDGSASNKRVDSPPNKERPLSSPATKVRKTPSPPPSKSKSDQQHTQQKYSRGMPPLVRAKDK